MTLLLTTDDAALQSAVTRNIFRDSPPSPEAVRTIGAGLRRFMDGLDGADANRIVAGELPRP